jgi:hypothetical protein
MSKEETRREGIFNLFSSNTSLFFPLSFVLSEKITIFVYLSGEGFDGQEIIAYKQRNG